MNIRTPFLKKRGGVFYLKLGLIQGKEKEGINMSDNLDYKTIHQAVAGTDAAFRRISRLKPAGGPASKVYPPTYSGGVYAWEKRWVGQDEVVDTVLWDSVQSQANRMEQALLEACREGKLKLPLLQVDFSKDFEDIGIITTLDAPHRIADAIFRDSLLNNQTIGLSKVVPKNHKM